MTLAGRSFPSRDKMNLLQFIARISFLKRLSLRTKLVFSFLFVVIAGGLLSSLIGTQLVANTIIWQAQNKVKYDLSTAWWVYNESLHRLRDVVQLTASGRTIPDLLETGRLKNLEQFLTGRRKEFGLDVLTLTDERGQVILRTHHPFHIGDDQSADPFVKKALQREPAASTAIVSPADLQREGSDLAERAFILFVASSRAKENAADREGGGMMLKVAVPVLNDQRRLIGVLYGGILLNRNYEIVDKVRELLYGNEKYNGREIGTVTIFQDGVRISTNVPNAEGARAIGTLVSKEVYEAVVQHGKTWVDRAFVVKDWYIVAYGPIRDMAGNTIGILYVGMLEAPYVDLRNKVVFSFFGIGVLGVFLVLLLSFFITTGIIRPLREMVLATRKIAEGDLSLELSTTSQDEIGQLADSFNHMLVRWQQARKELEDYGKTLEEKVEQRSQQLRRIQAQLMQSEKLTSLGRLASAVAHEIEKPLAEMLTFSHLFMRKLKNQPELQKELTRIAQETSRVTTLVRDLLNFARETKPQKRPCNINELILQTMTLVERQSAFQDIRIQKNLNSQIPLALLDVNQIQQVFMNILWNAADAMPNGGSLTVTTQWRPEDSFIQVQFIDTGCGIPEKNLHKIFDPFFTTKAGKKGTGLGLAVSFGIIDRHRGQIEVQSEEGKGTTVCITLPLQAAEEVFSA